MIVCCSDLKSLMPKVVAVSGMTDHEDVPLTPWTHRLFRRRHDGRRSSQSACTRVETRT